MKQEEAKQLAKDFLCQRIDLRTCKEPPPGYFQLQGSQEFIFKIKPNVVYGVGGDEYIAVSMGTDEVRCLNQQGE